MTLSQLLKSKPYLIWHIPQSATVSNQAAVEAILNYGDFNDVRKLIKILGMAGTAKIFKKLARQSRGNFRPQIKNYFTLFFKHYA